MLTTLKARNLGTETCDDIVLYRLEFIHGYLIERHGGDWRQTKKEITKVKIIVPFFINPISTSASLTFLCDPL